MRNVIALGAGGWLLWRIFGPEYPPPAPGEQFHPLPVPGRTVFVGNLEYMIRETGPADAPPLILLHGWVYESMTTWHQLAPRLAGRFRVIMIDQRNHGGSSKVRADYEVEDVADEVAAVMEAIGVERATIFGYSMGGMVGMELARRYPDRVSALVLGATAAHPVRLKLPALFVFGLLRGLWRVGRPEGARISKAIFNEAGAIDPRYDRWLWEKLMERDPELVYRAGAAIVRFDGSDWVGDLDVPILQIIPTRDQILRPRYQYETAARLADPMLLELPGARHESVLTHAGEIAEAVTDFVAKQEGP